MTPELGITYTGNCFVNVPKVDAQIDRVLKQGYHATASYIYAVFSEKK